MAVKAVAFLIALGGTAFPAEAARAEGLLPDPSTATSAVPVPPPPAPVAEAAAAVEAVAVAATEAGASDVQPAAPVANAVAPVVEAAQPVVRKAAKTAQPVVRKAAKTAAPARRAPEQIAASVAETKPQPDLRQAPAPPKIARQAEHAIASATPARAPFAARAAPRRDAVAGATTSERRRPERRSARREATTRTRPVLALPAPAAVAPTSARTAALLQQDPSSRPQPDRPSAAPALPRPGGPVDDDGADAGSLMAAAAAAGLNLSFLVALVAAIALVVPRPGRRLRLGMASRPPPPLHFALERPG